MESKYLEFFRSGYTGKTEVYDVLSKSRNLLLGRVRWFSRWRQYCFFPSALTVFNMGCLEDITKFIKELMEERRRVKKK